MMYVAYTMMAILYDSVIWQSDVVYGNNFNIIPQRGYFIRVNQVAEKEFLP